MDEEGVPWLSRAELDAWVPFSGMLVTLLSALEQQLQRDARLSLFGYLVMAGLSEARERTMPLSDLAVLANGSLSRLSHAVSTLERRGWVVRSPSPGNARITNATLTEAGYQKVLETAPNHVRTVRRLVLDVLSEQRFSELGEVCRTLLTGLAGPDRPAPRRRAEPGPCQPITRRPAGE